MGIKHFFYWYQKNFSENIFSSYEEESINVEIDTLLIDMNGILHNSAQKIYKYGLYEEKQSFFNKIKKDQPKDEELFYDICDKVDFLVYKVRPSKNIILCIDGPAPLSKQIQQRQRRFVSAKNRREGFDSISFTPGTLLMHNLSLYIEDYIQHSIKSKKYWKDCKVIFSNEKVPGEGEHKCLEYIKNMCPTDKYCLCGMDADLIMLSLAIHYPNFYILRENTYNYSEYFLININKTRKDIFNLLKWDDKCSEENIINDFIFMCFMVGNDFLPHIPGIEIIENSLEKMFDTYKLVGESYGYLTIHNGKRYVLNLESLKIFFGSISRTEEDILQHKYDNREKTFPDKLLESCVENKKINIKLYRRKYYSENFDNVKIAKICKNYLDGLQWILTYYTKGVSDWQWRYNYYYAPFSHTLVRYMKYYKFEEEKITKPNLPFLQLLYVLPSKSANLLPKQLADLIINSEIGKYYPNEFKIDLSGKRKEWEGIALLPSIDFSHTEKIYQETINKIHHAELVRNIVDKVKIYTGKLPM